MVALFSWQRGLISKQLIRVGIKKGKAFTAVLEQAVNERKEKRERGLVPLIRAIIPIGASAVCLAICLSWLLCRSDVLAPASVVRFLIDTMRAEGRRKSLSICHSDCVVVRLGRGYRLTAKPVAFASEQRNHRHTGTHTRTQMQSGRERERAGLLLPLPLNSHYARWVNAYNEQGRYVANGRPRSKVHEHTRAAKRPSGGRKMASIKGSRTRSQNSIGSSISDAVERQSLQQLQQQQPAANKLANCSID